MSITNKDKLAFERYNELCERIRSATSLEAHKTETLKEKEARIQALLGNYNAFYKYYFPHYGNTEPAPFHTKEAHKCLNNPFYQSAWAWFRGSAKSVLSNVILPIFLKCNKQLNFMVLVGDTHPKACKLLSSLQAELSENHRLIADFGKQVAFGSWAEGEFKTADGSSFYALGIGESPRGLRDRANRPDYIVVDDVDTAKRCKNPKLVREAADWVMKDLMGCFGGKTERFIIANNLISKNSILATLKENLPSLKYIQVNALDKNNNPRWAAKYTKEYWEQKKASLPFHAFETEFMNNPIEVGTVFKAEWIKWEKVPPLHKFDYLIAYCDPSFKNTPHSDFKAIKFWGKIKSQLYLINAFVRQCSTATMVKHFYDLHESLPTNVIVNYYIEANMLQDLLLDEFEAEGNVRGYQLPIRPDKRAKPDKFSRILATAPLYERGFITYNEAKKNDPDMLRAISHLLSIEAGSNTPDDSPDADEGAIWFMQKATRNAPLPIIGYRTKPKNAY